MSLHKFKPKFWLGFALAIGLIGTVEADVVPLPMEPLDSSTVSIEKQITLLNIRKDMTAQVTTLVIPKLMGRQAAEIVFVVPSYTVMNHLSVEEIVEDAIGDEIASAEAFLGDRTTWSKRFNDRATGKALTFGVGNDEAEIPATIATAKPVGEQVQNSLGLLSVLEVKEKDDLKTLLLKARISEEDRFRLRLYAGGNVASVKVTLEQANDSAVQPGFLVRYDTELVNTDRGFEIQLPFSLQRFLPHRVQMTGFYVETPRRMTLEASLPTDNPVVLRAASPSRTVLRAIYSDTNLSSDPIVRVQDTEQDVWWDFQETVSHWVFPRLGYWFGGLCGLSWLTILGMFRRRFVLWPIFSRQTFVSIFWLTAGSGLLYAVLAGFSLLLFSLVV